MLSPLGLRHRDPVFRSLSAPTVLLDPDLVIRAATPSYLLATGRDETEVLDTHLFDAFPENDATREIGSGEALVGSLQRVLRTGRPHDLGSLRYDVADRTPTPTASSSDGGCWSTARCTTGRDRPRSACRCAT